MFFSTGISSLSVIDCTGNIRRNDQMIRCILLQPLPLVFMENTECVFVLTQCPMSHTMNMLIRMRIISMKIRQEETNETDFRKRKRNGFMLDFRQEKAH
ncbi:hypothetical protein QQG55_31420 [Brugia pahangi]